MYVGVYRQAWVLQALRAPAAKGQQTRGIWAHAGNAGQAKQMPGKGQVMGEGGSQEWALGGSW